MNAEQIMALEDRAASGAYPRRPLAIVRGLGTRVWDAAGRAYLDLTGGQGVALIGHSHPAVAEAVCRQAGRLITCPEIFYNDLRARLYERLAARMPWEASRFFLCNSGAEAVEGAIKLARLLTGRRRIVAFRGAFHGRTLGALSATWNPRYRSPFEPLLPEVVHLPYNDPQALDEGLGPDVAAVLVEVVQGEGGVVPAEAAVLEHLQARCRQEGILLVVDEIQTGLGRTGRWLACEHFGLRPDVVCLGKGLAGGLPMGAVAWNARLGELPRGSHGSTFGGNPLACAAALATLDILQREDLPTRAAASGDHLMERLRSLRHPMVRQVRGLGLMVGLDLRRRVTPVLQDLMARGVLALPAGPTVLRLLPPLIIEREELDMAVEAIAASLEVLANARS